MRTNKKDEEQTTYLQHAEMAAKIVLSGIETENYSVMCEQLEELSKEKVSVDEYVFRRPSVVPYFLLIVLCSLGVVAFLFPLAISLGMLTLSESFSEYGLIGLAASSLVIGANISIISRAVLELKFLSRYSTYHRFLQYRCPMELIDDVADFAHNSSKQVAKDLNRAVRQCLIPEGHFGKDEIVFIATDAAYDEYLEKQLVYDRYYRKQREERMRMKERPESIRKMMDSGKDHLDRIREDNAVIKDKEMTAKLDRMENVVEHILAEADLHPEQMGKLGVILNYYLPTAEKLLDAYIELLSRRDSGIATMSMKTKIEHAMDGLNSTFEGILQDFYKEQEMDVLSEIEALEIMIQQEQ